LRATARIALAALVVIGSLALLHPSALQGLLPGFPPPVFHHPAQW
jgi:hypothetical protein